MVDFHYNIHGTIAQYIMQTSLCHKFQGFYFCDVDDYIFPLVLHRVPSTTIIESRGKASYALTLYLPL